MRKIKMSVLVVFILFLSLSSVTYANNSAEVLSKIGVFQGGDKGFELDREPTRLEGLIMMIRLLGKESNIDKTEKIKYDFTDVPEWGKHYVNYAYNENLTNGLSNDSFGSSNIITSKAYATLMLRVLGYDDSTGDFEYQEALEYMLKKDVIDTELYKKLVDDSFTRGDLAELSHTMLKTKFKANNKTLAEYLVASGAIEQSKALDLSILNEEIFKEKLMTLDLLNSYKGEEYIKIDIDQNSFDVETKFLEESLKYTWIQIKDTSGNKVFDEIFNTKSARINPKLSEGEYTFNIYVNESRNGTFNAKIWDQVFYVDHEGPYFKQSPIYGNNYMKQYFRDYNKELGETYYVKFEGTRIQSLALDLTKHIDSDYEKLKVIHDWVADNIYYDYDDYYSDEYGSVLSTDVIDDKRTVCSGYANLTAAMLRSIGIPTVVESGYALGLSTNGRWTENMINTDQTNHAWNRAYIDDRWVILDVTWNSNNEYRDGEFIYKGLDDYRYFDPTLETFSSNHKIK